MEVLTLALTRRKGEISRPHKTKSAGRSSTCCLDAITVNRNKFHDCFKAEFQSYWAERLSEEEKREQPLTHGRREPWLA